MEDGIKVAILVPVSFFALIFGIFYLRAREKLSMIERGMDPRIRTARTYSHNYILTAGLLLMGAGVGLFIAACLSETVFVNYDPTAIYMSLIALFAGLGLFSAYLIEEKKSKREKEGQD